MLAGGYRFKAGLPQQFLQGVLGETGKVRQFVRIVRVEIGHFHQQEPILTEQLFFELFQHPHRLFEVFQHMHERDQLKPFGFGSNQGFDGRVHADGFAFRQSAIGISRLHACYDGTEFLFHRFQEQS